MDPRYPAEAEVYRQKIQAILAEHLPADWAGVGALSPDERTRFVAEWRQTLADNHLLAVSWPKEYGGGGLSTRTWRHSPMNVRRASASSAPTPCQPAGRCSPRKAWIFWRYASASAE